MAEERGIRRFVRLILDRDSAKKTEAETKEAMARAGEVGGQAFLRELRQEFDQKLAELRVKLARGLISPEQFRREADAAARTFNTKLGAAVDNLRKQGQLTDKEFAKLGRRFKNVGEQGASAFGKIRSLLLSFGVALGARELFQRFDELIGRGGQLVQVSSAFTARVGDQAVALHQLRAAAKGLISDYDLMVAANQALTLGSAHSVDQVAELVEVSQRLGRALGIDANYALTSLNTGIARQSRLYLDNIGIIIDVDEANKAYAETLGKQAKELTELEKREAFRTAALGKAKDAINQLGEAVDSNADAWATFLIQLGNIRDNFAQIIAQSPKVRSAIDFLVNVTAPALDPDTVLRGDALDAVKRNLDVVLARMKQIREATKLDVLVLQESHEEYRELSKAQELLTLRLHNLSRAAKEKADADAAANDETERTVALTKEQQEVLDKLGEQLQMIDGLHEIFGSTVDVVGDKQKAYLQAIGALIREGLSPEAAAVRELTDAYNELHLAYLVGQIERRAPPVTTPAAGRPRRGQLGQPLPFGTGLSSSSSALTLPSEQFERDVERIMESQQLLQASAQSAAFAVAGAWQNAFALIVQGAGNAGDAVIALAAGIGSSLLQGLSGYASGKIAENIALAFEEKAKGTAALANPLLAWTAPVHFAAAKEHVVASVKWAVVGGLASGAAASLSSAGGGRGGTATATSIQFEGERQPPVTITHIYLDPNSATNPAFVEAVQGARIIGQELWGEQKPIVHMHSRTGR